MWTTMQKHRGKRNFNNSRSKGMENAIKKEEELKREREFL